MAVIPREMDQLTGNPVEDNRMMYDYIKYLRECIERTHAQAQKEVASFSLKEGREANG